MKQCLSERVEKSLSGEEVSSVQKISLSKKIKRELFEEIVQSIMFGKTYNLTWTDRPMFFSKRSDTLSKMSWRKELSFPGKGVTAKVSSEICLKVDFGGQKFATSVPEKVEKVLLNKEGDILYWTYFVEISVRFLDGAERSEEVSREVLEEVEKEIESTHEALAEKLSF